jgi:hypothetical protein
VNPEVPSLEDELQQQFGPGVLTENYDRDTEMGSTAGEAEEQFTDSPPNHEHMDYDDEVVTGADPLDLTGRTRHVVSSSDDEEPDENPLRTLIRTNQVFRILIEFKLGTGMGNLIVFGFHFCTDPSPTPLPDD